MAKVAWVTGASSGLGYHTARALQQRGWIVVGGARSFAQGAPDGAGFIALPLDVGDPHSIAAFCQRARQAAGEPQALVNCAAILIIGAAESYTQTELRQVMDINFFGLVAMTQACLGALRQAPQGGRIVNFSSVNGLFATPFQGAYSASKHAVEGFSEALAMETAALGIQVMLVEPGDHRGGSSRCRLQSRDGGRYAAACARVRTVIERDEAQGGDPARLGSIVAAQLDKKRMPLRLRVASPAQQMAIFLHDLLPSNLFFTLLRAYYRVMPPKRSTKEETP